MSVREREKVNVREKETFVKVYFFVFLPKGDVISVLIQNTLRNDIN